MDYYTAVLNDFANNRTENVLHLAQIPGALFNGTYITAAILEDTVNQFIRNYKRTREFQINIDFDLSDADKKVIAASTFDAIETWVLETIAKLKIKPETSETVVIVKQLEKSEYPSTLKLMVTENPRFLRTKMTRVKMMVKKLWFRHYNKN